MGGGGILACTSFPTSYLPLIYCSLGYFHRGFIFAEFLQNVIAEIKNSAKIYQVN